MSNPTFRSPWEDPMVTEAIRQRRAADIVMICCPVCGNYSYWNEGSHFSCSVDGCGHVVSGDELDSVIDDGDVATLDDLVSEDPGDVP